MSTFRRIMLSGGLDIDVDSLPETQKIYYTATSRVKGSLTSLGVIIVHKWNSSTKEGVIVCRNAIKEIGNYTFHGYLGLTSIDMPNSVTLIGAWAFYGCSSLASVYCKATTPPALGGNYVFDDNGKGCKIYVPTGSVDTYKSATRWSKYAGGIVGYDFENNTVIE